MRRLGRFLMACAVSAVVVGAAYGVWRYGLSRFDGDYCLSSVEVPSGAVSISSPEWEFPMTYRCDYGGAGERSVNEPRPLLWSGAMGGITVLAVSATWWRLAMRSPGPRYEGTHTT